MAYEHDLRYRRFKLYDDMNLDKRVWNTLIRIVG